MQILIDQSPIIAAVAVGLSALLLLWVIYLEIRLRRLTRGSSGQNLEAHIAQIVKDYSKIQEDQASTASRLEDVSQRLEGAVRGVGLVRFNPFAGSGDSKPSFALALLSESGRGVVVSTLCARDKVTLFSKRLENFKPESEITDEEREALDKARNSLHNEL